MLFDNETLDLTLLQLNGHSYAINTSNIIEALASVNLVRIAQQPAYMLGLIDLRGEVIPVIDTGILLENKRSECNLYLIVVKPNGYKLAFALDNVSDVFTLETSQLSNPPNMSSLPSYYKGFIQYKQETLPVLESDLMIADFKL